MSPLAAADAYAKRVDVSDFQPLDKKAIGERIKQRREALGMTQEDLAARIEARSATVSRYERGAMEPGLEPFAAIAKALSVSHEWLLHGDDAPPDRVIERPPAYAALEEFKRTREWKDATAPERKYLEDYRARYGTPTVFTYKSLLEAYRSLIVGKADVPRDADPDVAKRFEDQGGKKLPPKKKR